MLEIADVMATNIWTTLQPSAEQICVPVILWSSI